MSSTIADLQGVVDAAATLSVPAPGELSDAEVVAWLRLAEQFGRFAAIQQVRAAGELADRSRRELGDDSLARKFGASSAQILIERETRVSASEAARRVRLAGDTAPRLGLTGDLRPPRFAQVAAAFDAGEVGVDSALAIVRNLAMAERRASIEGLEAAELELVSEALVRSADLIAEQAKLWRDALDADGSEPRDKELREQRDFVIGRERADGMTPFFGLADPVSAAHLRAAEAERTAPDRAPRFLADDDPALEDADPALRDPRTAGQRRFDVFMGLLLAGVRAEAEVVSAKHGAANVLVIMTDHALATGKGTALLGDVHEPISAASAATIACDAGFQRVQLGTRGEPLALGRRERFHTAAQRKAIIVRDGPGCSAMDCTAPSSSCHAHHVVHWARGGPTDVDNGVLLCAFHHRLFHEGEWEIQMRDGIPYLRAPLSLDLTGKWRRMGKPPVRLAA